MFSHLRLGNLLLATLLLLLATLFFRLATLLLLLVDPLFLARWRLNIFTCENENN